MLNNPEGFSVFFHFGTFTQAYAGEQIKFASCEKIRENMEKIFCVSSKTARKLKKDSLETLKPDLSPGDVCSLNKFPERRQRQKGSFKHHK